MGTGKDLRDLHGFGGFSVTLNGLTAIFPGLEHLAEAEVGRTVRRRELDGLLHLGESLFLLALRIKSPCKFLTRPRKARIEVDGLPKALEALLEVRLEIAGHELEHTGVLRGDLASLVAKPTGLFKVALESIGTPKLSVEACDDAPRSAGILRLELL